MSTTRNDRFSDLQMAREASRSVRGLSSSAGTTRGYVRFESKPRVDRDQDPGERFGLSDWDRLVGDARALLRASSAFVVSDEGLIIAHSGEISRDDAEGMGSRAQLALDLYDEIDEIPSRRRYVVGSLDSSYLAVVRFTLGDEARVTLGLVVDDLPDARLHADLVELVDEVAQRRRDPA